MGVRTVGAQPQSRVGNGVSVLFVGVYSLVVIFLSTIQQLFVTVTDFFRQAK